MKRLLLICLWTVLASASTVAFGQDYVEGSRSWLLVLLGVSQGSASHATAGDAMEPMEPGARRPFVRLILKTTSPRPAFDSQDGAFCHGVAIAEEWVLTAASCVCGLKNVQPSFELLLKPATSRVPEIRAQPREILVFQGNAQSPPASCNNSSPPGVGTAAPLPQSTSADLALVRVATTAETVLDPVRMLGEDDQRKLLLGELADGSGSTTAYLRDVHVESVVIAQRMVQSLNRPQNALVSEYIFRDPALLTTSAGICGRRTTLVTVPWRGTTLRLCGNVAPDGQSRNGTPVLLSDHREPVVVGIHGMDPQGRPSITAVLDSVPQGTITVAESIRLFLKEPARNANWFPLPR